MPQERSRDIQYINRLRILSIYAVVTAHVTIGLTMKLTPFSLNWWLGVYVLHPLILKWIQTALRNYTNNGTFLAGVLLVPLVTFAACYLITSVLMNIPLMRRAVC